MLIFALITSGGWLSVPLNATCYCCMILIFNNYSKKKVRFGYEGGVGYNYLISNTRKWNNRFNNFFFNSKRLVITTEF